MTTTTFTISNERDLNNAIGSIDVGGADAAISMAGLMDWRLLWMVSHIRAGRPFIRTSC